MGTTYKAVLRVKMKADTVGIINIRETTDKKSKYYSLKVKVPVRLWNKKSGTVRKNDILDYERINQNITDKLREFEAYADKADIKPTQSKHSFVAYFGTYLKRYDNTGSRIKYETVLNKLRVFLKDRGKMDLLFHEIDSTLLYEFRDFARKKVSVNTATHYLKLIKQVLDSAVAQNHYTYPRHPYLGFEFKRTKVSASALTEEELKKLLNLHIDESDPLYYVRNCFIAQVFLQGMRVSDLQLLRWGMVKGDVIEYRMFKTNRFMSVGLTDIVWQILIYQLKKTNILLPVIDKLAAELKELEAQAKVILREEYDIIGLYQHVNLEKLQHPLLQKVVRERDRLFLSYKEAIHIISRDAGFKDKFIFDFLQNEDFSNIKNNDYTNVTEAQYKVLNHKAIVYNRHLKQLQTRAGISTVMKSHLSRSSYASLLLNLGTDVYNISAALGHTGLNITEKYLTGFNTGNTANINKQLEEKFSKNHGLARKGL